MPELADIPIAAVYRCIGSGLADPEIGDLVLSPERSGCNFGPRRLALAAEL